MAAREGCQSRAPGQGPRQRRRAACGCCASGRALYCGFYGLRLPLSSRSPPAADSTSWASASRHALGAAAGSTSEIQLFDALPARLLAIWAAIEVVGTLFTGYWLYGLRLKLLARYSRGYWSYKLRFKYYRHTKILDPIQQRQHRKIQ